MNYAFFDVDNTIYDGYTAADLIDYMNDKKLVDPNIKETYVKGTLDYKVRLINYNQISQLALDLVSLCVKGKDEATVQSYVDEILNSKATFLKDWVINVIKFLKEKDFKIVLISAGPDFFIKRIGELIGADEYYATMIQKVDSIYTGDSPILLNEDLKTNVIDQILQLQSSISIAFGDSTGDIPMLQKVHYPFVVSNNDHGEIIDYGNQNNWTVFNKAEDVIEKLKNI